MGRVWASSAFGWDTVWTEAFVFNADGVDPVEFVAFVTLGAKFRAVGWASSTGGGHSVLAKTLFDEGEGVYLTFVSTTNNFGFSDMVESISSNDFGDHFVNQAARRLDFDSFDDEVSAHGLLDNFFNNHTALWLSLDSLNDHISAHWFVDPLFHNHL